MMKVLGYFEKNIKYHVEYISFDNVLNISTELMNDDCIPYDMSPASIIWLDNNKLIGEMEYICPIISEINISIDDDVDEIFGVPQIRVKYEEKSVELFLSPESLTVILDREKTIEKRCISSNITFFISRDEIVAYECRDVKNS